MDHVNLQLTQLMLSWQQKLHINLCCCDIVQVMLKLLQSIINIALPFQKPQ